MSLAEQGGDAETQRAAVPHDAKARIAGCRIWVQVLQQKQKSDTNCSPPEMRRLSGPAASLVQAWPEISFKHLRIIPGLGAQPLPNHKALADTLRTLQDGCFIRQRLEVDREVGVNVLTCSPEWSCVLYLGTYPRTWTSPRTVLTLSKRMGLLPRRFK